MRRRSVVRNSLEFWLALVLLKTMEWAPLPISRAIGGGAARLLDLALPRLRRVGLRNLEMAFPEWDAVASARVIDGVFRSIGRVLTAFARFPRIRQENVAQWIRYEGYEHFENALRRGRGVMFATAHLGNWELSAYAHALLTAPMHVLVRPLDNPRIDALVERRRALSGNRVISKRDFTRTIFQALKKNQAVGILIDQNASPDTGVFVDFFGVPACAAAGFARIAARSGAAVIPGFALWSEEEARYILRFYPEVEITGDDAADTQRLQAVLEGVIRRHPDQWLWIHRRWKTRPPGGLSLYGETR